MLSRICTLGPFCEPGFLCDEGRDRLERAPRICILFAARKYVGESVYSSLPAGALPDQPRREIVRRQAPSGGCNSTHSVKWLVENLDTLRGHIRMSLRIGTDRHVSKQTESHQNQH